jgi:hypothetical protein
MSGGFTVQLAALLANVSSDNASHAATPYSAGDHISERNNVICVMRFKFRKYTHNTDDSVCNIFTNKAKTWASVRM